MPQKGAESVTLPEGLLDLVKLVVQDHPELGFQSTSEAVRDAIHEWLKIHGAYPATGASTGRLTVRASKKRARAD